MRSQHFYLRVAQPNLVLILVPNLVLLSEHAYVASPEFAGLFDKSLRHQLVSFQEVADGVWVKGHNLVVGCVCVLDFHDFCLFARDHLALDGEGRVNRLHTVLPVQFYVLFEACAEFKALNVLEMRPTKYSSFPANPFFPKQIFLFSIDIAHMIIMQFLFIVFLIEFFTGGSKLIG